MADNLYAPPKSDLSKPSENSEPHKNAFNRSMVIAAIIWVSIYILIAIVDLVEPDGTILAEDLAAPFIGFFHIILAIYLIQRVRVKGLGTSNKVATEALGVWGYFWRFAVTILMSAIALLVLVVLILSITGFDLTERTSMLTTTIIYGLVQFPAILLVVWAIFSKDRSGQFKSFIGFFRGY